MQFGNTLALLVFLLGARMCDAQATRETRSHVIGVVVEWPRASAAEVESSATRVIEDALMAVPNAGDIRSQTREGRSVVWVTIDATNEAAAVGHVGDAIQKIRTQLPVGVETPVVSPAGPAAVQLIAVVPTGDDRPPVRTAELTRVFAEDAADRLRLIPGVTAVSVSGVRAECSVMFSPAHLQGRGIATADALAAVRQALSAPDAFRQSRWQLADSLKDVSVGRSNGAAVRVRDVGVVEIGWRRPYKPSVPASQAANIRNAVLAISIGLGADEAAVLRETHRVLERMKATSRPVACTQALSADACSGDVQFARERLREQWPLPPGIDFEPSSVGAEAVLRPRSRWAYVIEITGPDTERLLKIANVGMGGLHDHAELVPGPPTPTMRIDVNRPRAADLGVKVMDITAALKLAVTGENCGVVSDDDGRAEVVVRFASGPRDGADWVGAILLRGAGDKLVALRDVTELHEVIEPQSLCRAGRQRIVYIGIPTTLNDRATLADAVNVMQEAAAKFGSSYHVKLRAAE